MNNIGISPEKMASFAREDLVAYIEKLVDYLSPRLGNNTHIARQKVSSNCSGCSQAARKKNVLQKVLRVFEPILCFCKAATL